MILEGLLFIKGMILSVIPFILLLGILVFIHELGHFMVARFYGVKVEVFSLGFGPKIFKFQKGETLYCISAIPLGGYVKMFGDNPFEEIPDSKKHRGFLYQKVHQKIAIALGGPLMNLFFTFFAFFILAFLGESLIDSVLGDIDKNTKAYHLGFRSGDRVVSVSGKKISSWEEVNQIIKNSKNKELHFEMISSQGEKKQINATTDVVKNKNIFELKKEVGEIDGFGPFSKNTTVGISKIDSPVYLSGMRTFDQIVSFNGKKIRYWRELENAFSKNVNDKITFEIKRLKEKIDFENLTFTITSSKKSLVELGIESSDLYISRVGKKTPAGKVGLKKGDRLVSINGEEIKTWKQVANTISKVDVKKDSLDFVYLRDGEIKTVNISPKQMLVEGILNEKPMVGIASGRMEILPNEKNKKHSFLSAMIYSNEQTWKWCGFIGMGLIRLIQGKISLRTMGGPVSIGRVAYNSFMKGFYSFLFIMALISLNLFFFNILPIPLLDGGHILFF